MFGRRKIAAIVAEFLGTGALTLLILSVQRSTIGVPFFVALAAGLTVALMSFALGDSSGAYFNPALTLGMWTARKLSTARAVVYIVAQFVGAYAAYGLYVYFVNNKLTNVGGHFTGRILVAEAVGTGVFAFGWAAAAYQGFTRAVFSSVAGLALVVGIVAASPAAIGLLNPAVAFGVKAWVWGTYVLGPVLGAVIGVNLYGMLFAEPEVAVAKVSASSSVVAKPVAKRSTAKKSGRAKK
jgi:aquaporin Z